MSTDQLRAWSQRHVAPLRPYRSTEEVVPRVRAYVAGTVVAAAALTGALLVLAGTTIERPRLVVAVAALVALEGRLAVRLRRGSQGASLAHEEALIVFAALLLPPMAALAAFALGLAVGQVTTGRGGVKAVFSIAQLSGSAALAFMIVEAAAPPGESPQRRALAALAGVLVFVIVNRAAVSGVIALTGAKGFRANFLDELHSAAFVWFGTVSVGLLAGLVALTHAWSLPFALAALVALSIAFSGHARARQLRQAYADVARSASAAFVSVDAAGFVRTWNPEMERVTGVPAEEARGAPLAASLRLRDEDDCPPIDLLAESFLSEPADRETVVIEARDGRARWLTFSRAGLPEGGFALVAQDMTEQLEGELAIRRSEERLRIALDAARLGHWDWELDSGEVRWSESLERICGLAPGSFGGTYEDFIAVVHEDDRARVDAEVAAALDEGHQELAFRIVRPDGTVRWLEDRGRVITDSDGRVRGMSGVSFDVTDRIHAEALATLQRRVLEEIATGAPLGDTLELLIGLIEEQSGSVLGSVLLLDESRGELRHIAAPSLPPEYAAALDGTEIGPEVGSCGTAAYLGEAVIVADIASDPLWADFRELALGHGLRACWSMPLIGSDGAVLGTFAMYYRDARRPTADELELGELATHLARIAIERVSQEERLVGAEEKYRRLVEQLPLAVYAFVPAERRGALQGVARYISPQAEKMLGYSPAEWRDDPDLYANIVHPDDRERVQAEVRRARAAGDGFRSEYRMVAKDGRTVWVHDESAYIHEEGQLVRVEGFLLDVSDRKALESSLVQSQKLEAVGQLAGGVAHDFNNLMSAVLGFSELVIHQLEPEHPARPQVEQIVRAGERAAALTGQLLAFSRKQVLQPRAFDLNAVVADSEQLLGRLIGEDVELSCELDPELAPVLADPIQLEQVIVNLAVNARDAMPTGGKLLIETANVELDAAYAASHFDLRPGQYVLLAVTDTGTGMDVETQSHIFEPFFTTKEDGEGTGLGLAMVFGVVKQTGGDVSVYSEPGRGTTFRIYLPRAAADAQPVDAAPEAGSRTLLPGSETILLVEDDDLVRDLERQVLEDCGYAVIEAPHPLRALELAAAHEGRIDLVLTDVVMPELSGRELVEQLAQTRPEMKVIYASGYTEDSVVRHGVLEAEVAFLAKPFTLAMLAAKVRSVLDEDGQASVEAA